MEIIDRIKFDGNGAPWLIYKCPSEEYVLGSQLIVNQGQEALFLKGGEALDLFGPGTHTLSTGNLPFLHKLVNLPFGGKTPFTAEIFYINKTAGLDMKWGTPTPIPLEDPRYGLILNVGARGQYGITISDSRLFVTRLIGAVPNGTAADPMLVSKYFNSLVNTKIKSTAASYMIQKQISFLEISQYLAELSDAFKEALTQEFARFGIDLVTFYCEAIAPKREEYEKLRGYKEEMALGEKFYQQRRSLNILEKLAENPSTGSATCPVCGAQNAPDMKFCGNCGSKLVTIKVCPYCGKEVSAGMKFCGNCGKPLLKR